MYSDSWESYKEKKSREIKRAEKIQSIAENIARNIKIIKSISDSYIRVLNINGIVPYWGEIKGLEGCFNPKYYSDSFYKAVYEEYMNVLDANKGDWDYRSRDYISFLSGLRDRFHQRKVTQREYEFILNNPDYIINLFRESNSHV